jgi:Tol biopolymer transport system component/tRNA A-37 threonylcarbamoyl transferase component Bud32
MTDAQDRLCAALSDRYTIERELGQGGMATVYLAEDLKHHRKVALKVLRPEIAATVGAGRFSREIEVAARLQHPNILPLLDSGEAAGFFFYVMPYVEGESLRERLARGGELPVQDAVRILMEVADALSEAHAHGVVHRDIKPDNVMLRGRHALVADFGVAKAVTEATGQLLLTSTGVALGTPMYMAPEQAMADPHQDHRVDIYALGLLGYELLTGRAPFSATTAQEMLAAHVTAVPDPVEKYRAAVSPALAQIIMKCLAKKPADRWQTAEEVLQHLEPLATPSGGTTPTQTRPIIALGNMPRWLKRAVGAVAVVIVALVATQLLKPKPLAITVSDFTQVTNDPGVEFQPAISPDGNEVVYAAGPIGAPHLFLRSTVGAAGGADIRLGDTTQGSEWFPSWTPDGQFVRFWGCPPGPAPWWTGCSWMETGKLGGAVRTVSFPPGAHGAALAPFLAWSPDGSHVAFGSGDTTFVATTSGGRTHALPGSEGAHAMAWSPDGKLLAYVSGVSYWQTQLVWDAGTSISVVSSAGGSPRQITTDDRLNVSPVWLDARHLLFMSDRHGQRAVYGVEVGPSGARGEPYLIPGLADPHSISYSIGARKLAYARFTVRQNIWAYPLDRSAPLSIRDGDAVTTGTHVITDHDLSPDGRWIAYAGNLRGHNDIYRMPSRGGPSTPLTSSATGGGYPRWSPDGREIAFMSSGARGAKQILVMPAAGGSPVALTHDSAGGYFPGWSPDGLHIAFQSYRSGRMMIWLVSRDSIGGPWHEAVQFSDSTCYVPDWAPDGTNLACRGGSGGLRFVSAQSGRSMNSDLLTRNHLRQLGVPRYSRDGKTIYYAATDQSDRQGIWALPVASGRARLVVAFDDPALGSAGVPIVGPDRLYLGVGEYESDIWVAKLRW